MLLSDVVHMSHWGPLTEEEACRYVKLYLVKVSILHLRNCFPELHSSALRTYKPRFHRLILHRLHHLQGPETLVRTCPTRLVSPPTSRPAVSGLRLSIPCPIACVFCTQGKSSTNSACFCSWWITHELISLLGRRLIDGLQTDTLPMLLGYEMAFLT